MPNIPLNTLCTISAASTRDKARMEVVGGTVNIYGSDTKPTTAPTGMYQTASGFTGIDGFGNVPSYIYITSASGTPVVSVMALTVGTNV